MWPKRGEALNRTVEAEAVLTDLYAEVLNQWVLGIKPLVLPTLTAAGDPPPDPDAVAQDSGVLDRLSEELILTGMSTLWCLSFYEAAVGLGVTLPAIAVGHDSSKINPVVLRTIVKLTDLPAAEIHRAVDTVDSDYELRESRNAFIESQRGAAEAIRTQVRDKVARAVRDSIAAEVIPEKIPEKTPPSVEVVIHHQREAVASVLTPGSEELRDVARFQGYQAAGVQNAAVIEAAARIETDPDEVMEKVWIATIDGKTRPTHFAADGQRTPLAGSFSVGGAALRFPADPAGPPEEVKNCRCRVGVLSADEKIPDEIDRHTERLDGRDSVQVHRKGTQRDEIERRAKAGTVRAREDEDGIGRTAAGGFVAPSEELNDMTGPVALAETKEPEAEAEMFRTFTDQPVAFIGIETSDGRMLAKDIELTVRTPPLPAMWCEKSVGGHFEAYTVGVLESAKITGDRINASGYWLNKTEADSAFEDASHKVSRPSVDLAATEWILTVDGKEISEEDWWDLPEDAHVVQTITKAELIGFTMVATPAFGETMIEFDAERASRSPAVVASAAATFEPRVYAAELFGDAHFTGPTSPQIDTKTGRVFGHLACFGSCHRSIQSKCIEAPRNGEDYGHFHTSPAVRLDNGTRVAVGRLTVGTGHAPDSLSAGPAIAHYDNTGTCWALVRVYEDEHGIAFSGVTAPWATAEQIEQGLASPLSGDWRDMGSGLKLIAALSVNTPGFAAARGRDGDDGRPAALVASLGPARGKRMDDAQLTAEAIGKIVESAIKRDRRQLKIDSLVSAAVEKVGPPPTAAEKAAALLARAREVI